MQAERKLQSHVAPLQKYSLQVDLLDVLEQADAVVGSPHSILQGLMKASKRAAL
jgi:hypothetical protein